MTAYSGCSRCVTLRAMRRFHGNGYKKIAFITGTRADFGKIQSLMSAVDNDSHFDMHIFVTGMHMQAKYGSTVNEIIGKDFPNIYKYINNSGHDSLDKVLANTISGFGDFVRNIHPDMIVVHGDRAESLAGACRFAQQYYCCAY